MQISNDALFSVYSLVLSSELHSLYPLAIVNGASLMSQRHLKLKTWSNEWHQNPSRLKSQNLDVILDTSLHPLHVQPMAASLHLLHQQ